MIYVKIFCMYGILKILQFNINIFSKIVQKLLGELKSQAELIF